jgi:hypothetical protein
VATVGVAIMDANGMKIVWGSVHFTIGFLNLQGLIGYLLFHVIYLSLQITCVVIKGLDHHLTLSEGLLLERTVRLNFWHLL